MPTPANILDAICHNFAPRWGFISSDRVTQSLLLLDCRPPFLHHHQIHCQRGVIIFVKLIALAVHQHTLLNIISLKVSCRVRTIFFVTNIMPHLSILVWLCDSHRLTVLVDKFSFRNHCSFRPFAYSEHCLVGFPSTATGTGCASNLATSTQSGSSSSFVDLWRRKFMRLMDRKSEHLFVIKATHWKARAIFNKLSWQEDIRRGKPFFGFS